MATNRGKAFEECIKEAFEAVPDTTIDRLHDQTTGFLGSTNICDFIAYRFPYIYYLECKSVHGNTLPFTNITENQWKGLLSKSKITGVIAGYIIWFVDHDITVFINAQEMKDYRDEGNKSVHVKKLHEIYHHVIEGRKKRVFFEYDVSKFLGIEDTDW